MASIKNAISTVSAISSENKEYTRQLNTSLFHFVFSHFSLFLSPSDLLYLVTVDMMFIVEVPLKNTHSR